MEKERKEEGGREGERKKKKKKKVGGGGVSREKMLCFMSNTHTNTPIYCYESGSLQHSTYRSYKTVVSVSMCFLLGSPSLV